VLDGILLVVDCVELEYCWIWIRNPFDGFSGLEGRLGNANLSPSGVIDNNSSVVQDAKARAGDSSESDGLPKGSD
jgi:hypothetical protein